jgi:hypothetical protein
LVLSLHFVRMNSFFKIVVLTGLYLVFSCTYAQDIIIKRNGEEVIGRVVSFNSDSVHYQHFSDTNGPKLSVARHDIAHVKLIAATTPESELLTSVPDELPIEAPKVALQMQAKIDAKAYYKAKGVFWTTMGSTVMHPLAGLVTGTLFIAVPPNINSDFNPNRHLLKEPVYRETFQKQARKKKIGKAAAGFGAGAAVVSVVYMAIILTFMGS